MTRLVFVAGFLAVLLGCGTAEDEPQALKEPSLELRSVSTRSLERGQQLELRGTFASRGNVVFARLIGLGGWEFAMEVVSENESAIVVKAPVSSDYYSGSYAVSVRAGGGRTQSETIELRPEVVAVRLHSTSAFGSPMLAVEGRGFNPTGGLKVLLVRGTESYEMAFREGGPYGDRTLFTGFLPTTLPEGSYQVVLTVSGSQASNSPTVTHDLP